MREAGTKALAASVALRPADVGADPDVAIVWEPVGGPRFPNGAVAGTEPPGDLPERGPVRAARWWDPTCPVDVIDEGVAARFVASLDALALPGPPEACIGWGPGKTPAGDDVVVGLLIGLRAAGRLDLAAEVADAIAGVETAPFSQALLDHATRGQAAGPVLRCIDALGGRRPLDPAVAGLLGFGATSGRHLLDGIRRALLRVGVGGVGAGVDFDRCGTPCHITRNQNPPTILQEAAR